MLHLVSAFGACALDSEWHPLKLICHAFAAGSLDSQRRMLRRDRGYRLRHPHDLIGHAIRFALVLVVGGANRQLCLKCVRAQQARHPAVAERTP
jgi:hypothetical protein